MKAWLWMLIALCSAPMLAGDNGDAPAGYGTCTASFSGGPKLGNAWSGDATQPVSPAWTGDNDDGVVGSPNWTPGSSANTLTVQVSNGVSYGMLTLWIDANDDGQWTPEERYDHPASPITGSGQYTFTQLSLPTINYIRNARNRVAIRLINYEPGWVPGSAAPGPACSFWFGEVEDWLIPVTPAPFSISGFTALPEAEVGSAYVHTLSAINGTPPYTWSLVSGALPSGISLTQSGNDCTLSGTPVTATNNGAPASFTIQCADSGGGTSRTLTLRVNSAAASLPFSDSFSTDKGWHFGPSFARVATAQGGPYGWPCSGGWSSYDPAVDATPGSGDNMVLCDSPAAAYQDCLPTTYCAVSPALNCSGISSVELSFMRWLAVDDAWYDHAGVSVSCDGVNWTLVWCNPTIQQIGDCFIDRMWTRCVCDISAVAANQPRVWIRFEIGASDTSGSLAGWSVDDVIVRQTPSSDVTVTQFAILSPWSLYGDPVCYLGSVPWSATVDNLSSEAVSITGIQVGVIEAQFPGIAQTTWHDVGTWTLTTPVTVPASATGFVVNGTFTCSGPSAQGAMIPLTALLRLIGTGTVSGGAYEGFGSDNFYIYNGPQPGLRVHETTASGPEIANGAAAASMRDFGSQLVGVAGNWRNFVLKNTSSNALTLGLPQLVGAAAADFELYTASYNTTLAPSQTTWFSIRFKPLTTGAKSAQVSLSHDAINTGTPFVFEVIGNGAANGPVLEVAETAAGGTPIANGSAASGLRDFGNVDIHATAGALVINIANTGNQPLTLGTPSISGSADFTLDLTGLTLSVAPGTSTSFGVYFDPANVGAASATISFAHNDTGTTTPFSFGVAGFGVINQPLIRVTESIIGGNPIAPGAPATGHRNFGTRDVSSGASALYVVVIENAGWQPLTLGAPVLAGANASDFILDTASLSLVVPAQTSTWFGVAFDPAQKGVKLASLNFTHDDPTVISPFTFSVTGLAVDPYGVTITTHSLPHAQAAVAYGPVALQAGGGTQPYTWTLEAGNLPPGLVLATNGQITGTPSTAGVYSFTVRVTDDLGGNETGQVDVIVTPAPGDIGKTLGGGCSVTDAAGAWVPATLILAALSLLLRRRRASKKR